MSFNACVVPVRLLLTVFTLSAGLAISPSYLSAQIFTIPGPLPPVAIETWESFPSYIDSGFNHLPNPTSIMGGQAQISNPVMSIYAPGHDQFGLGDSGWASVADGAKGMGLNASAQTAVINFAQPISAFGAFWGAATSFGVPATVIVRFFDSSLNQIGPPQQFNYSRDVAQDGMLQWHGWGSTVNIRRVSFTGDYVVNDGMRTMLIPEPSTTILVGFAALVIGCAPRRNRV